MNRRTIGILAHVDAGKTTLSEAMLYMSGTIRKAGRVDHQDAFLDTDRQEKERGITIFSKQAVLRMPDLEITLLDTPGHVDFSGEAERVLWALDYAILVISASDGVQSHTRTLWQLLKRYRIPVFIFVNKMDLPDTDRQKLLADLGRLDAGCVDFSGDVAVRDEEAATTEEAAMEEFLSEGCLGDSTLRRLIRARSIYPVYYGSALHMEGVTEFLTGLADYTESPEYKKEFAARVFKITRDDVRLTWMKITGGVLPVKTVLDNDEKADQIRIYSGARYTPCQIAEAGMVCAVSGLTQTYAGQGLGGENSLREPRLESFLSYQVIPPEGKEEETYRNMKILEEEDPELGAEWDPHLRVLHVKLMGEVQREVLIEWFRSRFGYEISLGTGRIVYRETILNEVEGIGHYEPLRHYAEVHLVLSPGAQGSGMQFDSTLSQDVLASNWQNLVMQHLKEKEHLGVLTGSPITDMKITLVNGRAHIKHTVGGDFRQATYRAVRQGLMSAKSRLLEPYYSFRLEVPLENVGRAMTDLLTRNAVYEQTTEGDTAVLTGRAPVSEMMHYPVEVASYTHGKGLLSYTFYGYLPCHNEEEVIEETGYDPVADLENSPDSIFCSHGAGFLVPWDRVSDFMHLEGAGDIDSDDEDGIPEDDSALYSAGSFADRAGTAVSYESRPKPSAVRPGSLEEDKELQAIFERTYGKVETHRFQPVAKKQKETPDHVEIREVPEKREYLLVDGYNIIHAWEELARLAETNMDAARVSLADRLSNCHGFRKETCILVFDAYRVPRDIADVIKYHNIYIVYTKEAETADTYIEKASFEISRHNLVRVATSDATEQRIVLGNGALRMSAEELHDLVRQTEQDIRDRLQQTNRNPKNDILGQALAASQKGEA